MRARHLDKEKFYSLGLDKTVNKTLIANPQAVQPGDLFSSTQGRLGGMGLQIYHDEWLAAPDNSFVEILHTAVPTEL